MLSFLIQSICGSDTNHIQDPPSDDSLHPTFKDTPPIHITPSQKFRFSSYPISLQIKRTFGNTFIKDGLISMPLKKDKLTKKPLFQTPPTQTSGETLPGEELQALMSDLDTLEDNMTCQRPSTSLSRPRPNPKSTLPLLPPEKIESKLTILSALFLNAPDCLNSEILQLLEELNKENGNPNPSLKHIYTKLTHLIKDDFWQINLIGFFFSFSTFMLAYVVHC